MCSFFLPIEVLEAIDKRRRAFFWTGSDRCNGSQCLISWDKFCFDRDEGPIGMKDLRRKEFLHKLLSTGDASWKNWFSRSLRRDLGDSSSSPSFLELIVNNGLLLYCALTKVNIEDGRCTFFWINSWLPVGRLEALLPALFFSLHKAQHLCGQMRSRLAFPLCSVIG